MDNEGTADGEGVTSLLRRWRGGDADALEQFLPRVYDELHRLAARALRGERIDHTLQTTALVHEAYLRLAGNGALPDWQDRVHFFAVAARSMRRVLVDHARRLRASRRGSGAFKVELLDGDGAAPRNLDDLLDLDRALDALTEIEPRRTRVIELRFFAGLSVRETAEALGVSEATVVLDTRLGRAMLYRWIRRHAGRS